VRIGDQALAPALLAEAGLLDAVESEAGIATDGALADALARLESAWKSAGRDPRGTQEGTKLRPVHDPRLQPIPRNSASSVGAVSACPIGDAQGTAGAAPRRSTRFSAAG
jgi:hypothetical protein